MRSSWLPAAYRWDGTPEGAEEIIAAAVTSAANVSEDHWVTDGWRTQTERGAE